ILPTSPTDCGAFSRGSPPCLESTLATRLEHQGTYRCGVDRLYKWPLAPRILPRVARPTPPDRMMSPPPPHPDSRLEALLRARQFAITAEITPPVACEAEDLLRKATPLAGLADAVNVTDGAGARAHLSAPIAACLIARAGIEPILQFTCRDRNRLALQADLMGAAACGVRNILCLTGDDPKAGDQPQTKPVFDVDSVTLTAMARELRDKGELPSGRKVLGRASFFLGAADVPIDPP